MLRVEVHAVPRTAPPTVTLHCSGKLVLGWETETLRYMTKSRTEACLILDLREVQTADAAGLGLLVELYCWAQHGNKVLTLANVSAGVRKLFWLTNLQSVFAIADSPEAGLADAADEAGSRFGRREMTA
jgi:anti-anti-sigma factor